MVNQSNKDNEKIEVHNEIMISEVVKAVKRSKNGKAAGQDNIKVDMIKYMGAEGLIVSINMVWKTGDISGEIG